MLANSIALVTLALMLGSEAKRANPPWNYGLWTLATIVLLVAIGLQPINERSPEIGAFLTSIFNYPVAWFVLFIGLFLAIRPFWSGSKNSGKSGKSPQEIGRNLGSRAGNIAMRINLHRNSFSRVQEIRDPMPNIINEGISLLISFEKQGFGIPQISKISTNEQAAFAFLEYFTRMSPLLRDGHFDEAKIASSSIATQAVDAALTTPQRWS